MSTGCVSDSATYYPSLTQRYHDLTMIYLEKTFDFSKCTPTELMEEYTKISEELKSTYKQLKKSK